MAGTFARARGGRIKVRLGDADRAVVAGLLEAVAEMLEPTPEQAPAADADLFARFEAELAVRPPADPAVARLRRDASHDDPQLAESFRRLTQEDLRERKRTALALAAAALRR